MVVKSMLPVQTFLVADSIHAVELELAAMTLVTMKLIFLDRAQWGR